MQIIIGGKLFATIDKYEFEIEEIKDIIDILLLEYHANRIINREYEIHMIGRKSVKVKFEHRDSNPPKQIHST